MPTLTIRQTAIDVDITAELEAYEWIRPRWTAGKLIAASPFRYESTPSFFVSLETGGWHDSGALDEWSSGNFVKLLGYLRDEPTEDTEAYLLATYGGFTYDDAIRLDTSGYKLRKPNVILGESIIQPLSSAGAAYVRGRGIHEKVVALNGLGYASKAIQIPWRDPAGRLANVKYRRIDSKTFWYESGGRSLRSLVFGADIAYKRRIKRAVLCEAEFDAMTWQSAGLFGLAVGGASLTQRQADIIKRSAIEELVLGGDNDAAGAKFNAEIRRLLGDYVRLSEPIWPPGSPKDANEAGVCSLQRISFREISTIFPTWK